MPRSNHRRQASRDTIIRRILDLRQREVRHQTGVFYAEGVRFLADAVKHRAPIQTLVIAPSLLTNAFGRSLVRHLQATGVPSVEVPQTLFRRVSLHDEPQGVGLIVRQRWERLARVRPGDEICWVALDAVRSPGNLGSVIRTCEAVGAAGLVLLGDAIDPYDPVTVRATMGAIFAQRFVRATTGQLAAWAERHHVTLVGTSPSAPVDYRSAEYRRPFTLLMGGERKGLAPQHQALCDLVVTIPMAGSTDSLNLAVAPGVMLYEVFNRHRAVVGISVGG